MRSPGFLAAAFLAARASSSDLAGARVEVWDVGKGAAGLLERYHRVLRNMHPKRGFSAMRRRKIGPAAWVLGAAVVCARLASAGPGGSCAAGEPSAAKGRVILDTDTPLRRRCVWSTDVLRNAEGKLEIVPLKAKGKMEKPLACKTESPPAGWTADDFDDGAWARMSGSIKPKTPEMSLICLRGRFEVADPGKVKELFLAVSFTGGTVAYVNGQEVGRAGLPAGEIGPDTPAEMLPPEAYLDVEGFLYVPYVGRNKERLKKEERNRERLRAARVRELKTSVPGKLLRPGVNVLAVEIHRAPFDPVGLTGKVHDERHRQRHYVRNRRLGLESLALTVPEGTQGVGCETSAPKGLRAWNQPILQRVFVGDCGEPGGVLPLRLAGPRNSVLSGQIVLSSDRAMKGLKASATDLKSANGKAAIPASAVEILYLVPGGAGDRKLGASFEALSPESPAEVAVDGKAGRAMQPVWFRLRVPREVEAGEYAGKVSVAVEGCTPVQAELHASISGWTMPPPQEFTGFVGLVQSPESVALQYDVPLWSEKHWRKLDRSFELMGEVGAKYVYVTLIRRTHYGNEHAMVRWIRKEGGGYDHDFSIAEKYLDLAVKRLGKPQAVCLYCWEFVSGARTAEKSKGMQFTVLDPKTGKLEEAEGPKWGTPECREFWKPVMEGMRQRLANRGLESAIMVGMGNSDTISYGRSSHEKAAAEDLKALVPGCRWALAGHPLMRSVHGVPVGYLAHVWGNPFFVDPAGNDKWRKYAWKNKWFLTAFPRTGCSAIRGLRSATPLVEYAWAMEALELAGMNGFGRVGADFWNVLGSGEAKRKHNLLGRYPESGWGQCSMNNSSPWLLWPGKEGALSTVRLEMVRAGQQALEARVYLEKALTDPAARGKLGEGLAGRCQSVLDERMRAIYRARGNIAGWPWLIRRAGAEEEPLLEVGLPELDAGLFAAAAEVSRALQ